jgi:hypothetical protein
MVVRSKVKTDSELNELEAHLAGTLRPVSPPKEIVHRLRQRIRFPQPREIASQLRREWGKMFLVFGGVMSGFVALLTIARAFFYFVGRRHG